MTDCLRLIILRDRFPKYVTIYNIGTLVIFYEIFNRITFRKVISKK